MFHKSSFRMQGQRLNPLPARRSDIISIYGQNEPLFLFMSGAMTSFYWVQDDKLQITTNPIYGIFGERGSGKTYV